VLWLAAVTFPPGDHRHRRSKNQQQPVNTPHVFSDPSGRRKLLIGFLATLLLLLLVVCGSAFLFSLRTSSANSGAAANTGAATPGTSAAKPGSSPVAYSSRRAPVSNRLLESYRQDSLAAIREVEAKKKGAGTPLPKPAQADAVVVGFYAPWQTTGLNSLRSNADKLTHVMPEWVHLGKDGASLDLTDWEVPESSRSTEVKQIAQQHHLQVWPILNNYADPKFDADRVHKLLQSAPLQQKLAATVRDWLKQQGYQGLNLDFESLAETDYAKLGDFLKVLGNTLHAAGLGLSMDMEAARLKSKSMPAYVAANDFIVLMSYDEHDDSSAPGAIASAGWFLKVFRDAEKVVPRDKLVLGIGGYGYDWTTGQKQAESISYQQALLRARDYGPKGDAEQMVRFDGDSLNPRFEYADEKGGKHKVWFLDGVTAANQWSLGRKDKVRGAALWLLGSEDPSVWEVLDKSTLNEPVSPANLEKISFPYEIEFVGEGEILSVISEPSAGERKLTFDAATGLCTNVEYSRFPSCYVIQRRGYQPKKLALTFDDGPSAEFTPPILEALRQQNVPATFFVIGQNAANFPNLIQQIWKDGHELGNHTFTHPNLSVVSNEREVIELNGTKRAIESILGRSTIWFRPPYQADAEPSSAEEVRPIVTAAHMGYSMVGELIDPQDWNLWKGEPGYQTLRNGDDIAKSVMEQVGTLKANVILLHDAGGDRSATVKALSIFVPQLKAQGYQFVRISDLVAASREDVMPALSKGERLITWIDGLMFGMIFSFLRFLALAFVVAIGLGIARVAFVTSLALWVYFRSKPNAAKQQTTPAFEPLVSVIIPAYNERGVVARTIRSVLENDYTKMEIVFVDDGSTDGTADAVEREFEGNPYVRIVRQANGGKAAALNNGIKQSTGEIIVGLDADTQFPEQTISRLLRHFANARVGAVAGNVKVGNRINLITKWQALEYITSQNVDRLAYAQLNAVTVVPGAIGAWRRQALEEVGGYLTDTLAEDMDLTWRIRRKGWKIETEAGAVALTEAPATTKSFFKQRFRWSYGTLQCLWKHRGALFHYGWFGWVGLPTLWLFQIVFQVLAPLVDLQVLYALWTFGYSWFAEHYLGYVNQAATPPGALLEQTLLFYFLFWGVEMAGAAVAVAIDRDGWRLLPWLFLQRFFYRQLMYVVLWKALLKAVLGDRMGWGKLERRGTVHLEPTGT
jgi:cellulose synthase/poly-beta-1,6-N-acetylglucosamine synthase-like glycosyltransferase/spore germination protein YaaH/peptidoglycan/xylan/chitin deacetylase (PgdA/CDA1 family)